MRFILPFLISILSLASEFPEVFSSTGDDVYKNMKRYSKIIVVYKDNSEFLEAYCLDANRTMQKGFKLDEMKNNPEEDLDKKMLKSYVQELRDLSNQNETIIAILDEDIGEMINKDDFKSLKIISDAGFGLSPSIMYKIKISQKSKTKSSKPVSQALKKKKSSKPAVKEKHVEVAVVTAPPKARLINKKPTELQYYEQSLVNFKSELYELRETHEEEKTACLNDVTAINYWMIKVLKNSNHACERGDAIKQMKSYGKASSKSCGRESLRYVEWKNRIKPYVGQKLYEAEAGCNR